MKVAFAWCCLWATSFIGLVTAAEPESGSLRVHLAQANNRSPYTFVRAKFEPGEVNDPWAVRFVDEAVKDIPYFVWDSVTWQVAREGRADWGHRYALVNHAPGNAPDVLAARGQKLQAVQKNLPALGAKLAAREVAAERSGNSVCAAIYLLRHPVKPFGKERIALRTFAQPQLMPQQQHWTEKHAGQPISVAQGELVFHDLPDRLRVTWKGKEIFHYAGFDAGQTAGAVAHTDRTRPFTVETSTGIITRLSITGQTPGRSGGNMDWQCTYWLFPEGSYVALEGFSLSDTAGYIGGNQKMSIWQGAGDFSFAHEPLWENPWWLHQAGNSGFVATHMFHSTPLTVGYGNNPFTVNTMSPPIRAATMELNENQLGLRWFYSLDDLAISRLFAPELYFRLGHGYTTRPEDAKDWLDGNRQDILAGKVSKPPEWMTPQAKAFIEEQLKLIRWQPKTDWLYRQYAVGVGEQAKPAEDSLRQVLGAATGWIDRPFDEEELASLLVQTARSLSADASLKWSREMEAMPSLLNPDPAGLKQALARWPNEVTVTENYIQKMETNRELGGNPLDGRTANGGEGWIVNPSYHATTLPYYVRFLQHFDLPHPENDYRQAIVRFADYSLNLLAGEPHDFDKLRKSYTAHWPSRFIAIVPLMLAANDIQPDPKYTRAATMMFDVLMEMVERNPQGYWSPWGAVPKQAEPFDTVYNGAGTQRGLPAFWSDGKLNLIGRERASNFVAAQARYLVFSGQLLDTLETDNVTAIYATKHGGHPSQRKQIPLFLWDDFEFYRGLVGNLVEWSAASPSRAGGHGDMAGGAADRELGLAESGCYLLRWALGMGSAQSNQSGKNAPASKWFESRTEQLGDKDHPGFRLRVWNRLPWAESTLSLGTRDIGLNLMGPKGPADHSLLWLRFSEPAYREPLTIEVTAIESDRLAIEVTRPVQLRLHYGPLCPDLSSTRPIVLTFRRPDGTVQELPEGDSQSVVYSPGLIEWSALAGDYELRAKGR